jgi:hypothetical protein
MNNKTVKKKKTRKVLLALRSQKLN